MSCLLYSGLAVFLLLILPLSSLIYAAEGTFNQWLTGFREDAVKAGISSSAIEAVIPHIELQSKALELDRRQPETTLSLNDYLQQMVSKRRIAAGVEAWRQNHRLIAQATREYGVEGEYLVALWGIETGYGKGTGNMPVASCLATLAYDGRRGAYFKSELLDFLRLVAEGKGVQPDALGSWAGAMGQFQFMPSSYLKFAVDFNHDGKRDLWGSTPDALGSAANYLHSSGWIRGAGWGKAVKLPAKFSSKKYPSSFIQSATAWRRLGFKLPGMHDDVKLHLIQPEGKKGPAFLVTANFEAILTWNRSASFALAVGQLADRIRAEFKPSHAGKAKQ